MPSAESGDPIAIVDRSASAGPTTIVDRNATVEDRTPIAGAVRPAAAALPAADAVAATDQNSNWAEKPGETMNGSPFV